MTFLNSYLLLGLPLAALPIIIHLINRQRHRSVPWGAMMFLLDAKRLQRSMAKLRYWLILAMRVLSIAGLIFAISRPLSTGWLGTSLGSRADTVLLLLDRSPSMEQTNLTTQRSKRETALAKFQDLMEKTGEGKRLVLIESTRQVAETISVADLGERAQTSSTDTVSNIPAMLVAAGEYLSANSIAQADVWIASDLRSSDWEPEDGRWSAIRDTFATLPGVRFHLLTYATPADNNVSVRVDSARRRDFGQRSELALRLLIQGTKTSGDHLALEILVNGTRSVLDIEAKAGESVVEHTIPLDVNSEFGWGKVSLPADENPQDNDYFFTFGPEPVRQVTIVSDDEATSRPLQIASRAGADPTLDYEVVLLPSHRAGEIDWKQTSCVIWHADLPTDTLAQQVDAFLSEGRPVLCLPPEQPSTAEYAGHRWGTWQTVEQGQPIGIGFWDNDTDLLAKTQAGNALPVAKQTTSRYCELVGENKVLARFTNELPLLARANANVPLYFLTTLPRPDTSSLAEDGVVLYAMIQRALELGASTQGASQNISAGTMLAEALGLKTLVSPMPETMASGEFGYHAGCHRLDDVWLSVNRIASEDETSIVSDDAIGKLFSGLDYQAIQDELGSSTALANEVWRLFLVAMAMALVVEAVLCLG